MSHSTPDAAKPERANSADTGPVRTYKVVYCGVGRCGKTTSLARVYDSLAPDDRSDMLSLSTLQDRTVYFDMMALRDLDVGEEQPLRVQLYTVPGQIVFNSIRQVVLRGVDAIVYVVDSSESLLEENLESLRATVETLRSNGLDPWSIPWVLQYNKRDAPDALSREELDYYFNSGSVELPAFESVASEGRGVLEPLDYLFQNHMACSRREASDAGPPLED